MPIEPTVFVVDDDASMRESLCFLLQSVGLACSAFSTAEAFLAACDPAQPGCLVLDLRMPGMGGLALQEELGARGIAIPIIFVTAYGEVSTAVRAIKGGAIDFLEKPFSDQTLVDRVSQALALDQERRNDEELHAEAAQRVARLSPRQRQVLDLVVQGKSNKLIAETLRIREKTVEVHRAQVMRKLNVNTIAGLVQLALDSRSDRGKPVGRYRKFPN
jgi:FixJ family two-component response regulator